MNDARQEATGDRLIHDSEQLTQHLIQLANHVSTVVGQSTSDMKAHFDSRIRGVTAFPPNGMLSGPPSQDYDSTARQLQAEIHEPGEKIAKLEADEQGSTQILEAKRRSLEDENTKLDKKLRGMEVVLQRSRADVKRLSSILVKGKIEDSGPTDDQIRGDFRGLMNAILKLAHKNFQAKTVSYSHHSGDSGQKQSVWLHGWPHLTPELRIYRVRAAIFDVVLDTFFTEPYFGLDGRVEKALRWFELELEKNVDVSRADIVEWRRRTVTAAKAFEPVDEAPKSAAKEINEKLKPVFTPPSNGPTATIYPEILELCKKAEQISLILRQSRATFDVSTVRKHQSVDQSEDSKMELVAIEGQPSSTSVKVNYTVFGGLVKTTLFPGEDDVVVTLEKPIVVGYCA